MKTANDRALMPESLGMRLDGERVQIGTGYRYAGAYSAPTAGVRLAGRTLSALTRTRGRRHLAWSSDRLAGEADHAGLLRGRRFEMGPAWGGRGALRGVLGRPGADIGGPADTRPRDRSRGLGCARRAALSRRPDRRHRSLQRDAPAREIGRAECRERV